MDVFEFELEATLIFKLRAENLASAQELLTSVRAIVGTFMVDTSDWRFQALNDLERDDIVEIYAEAE